jgi:uncharacterized protein (DUF342 family)
MLSEQPMGDSSKEKIQKLQNEIKYLREKLTKLMPMVQKIKKELFQINDRIFIINAKDSIANNTEVALSRYFKTDRKKFDIV